MTAKNASRALAAGILCLSFLVQNAVACTVCGSIDRTWWMQYSVLHQGGPVRQLAVGRSDFATTTAKVAWLEESDAIFTADPFAGAESVLRVDDGRPTTALAAAGDELYRLTAGKVERLTEEGTWRSLDLGSDARQRRVTGLFGRPETHHGSARVYLQLEGGAFGFLNGNNTFSRVGRIPPVASLRGNSGGAAMALEDGSVVFVSDRTTKSLDRLVSEPVDHHAVEVLGEPDGFAYLDGCGRARYVRRMKSGERRVVEAPTRGRVIGLATHGDNGPRFHILKADGSLWWKIAEDRKGRVPDEHRREPLPDLLLAAGLEDIWISRFIAVTSDSRMVFMTREEEWLGLERQDRRARFRELHFEGEEAQG